MKSHEIISVFCKYGIGHQTTMGEKRMPYNPQGLLRHHTIYDCGKSKFGNTLYKRPSHKNKIISEWTNYPTSVLYFALDSDSWHPTQKPLSLIRYLINTYTEEEAVILDNCMGSGTTAVACIMEKRNFIGFELDTNYFNRACERIKNEQMQYSLF